MTIELSVQLLPLHVPTHVEMNIPDYEKNPKVCLKILSFEQLDALCQELRVNIFKYAGVKDKKTAQTNPGGSD